ncbi:MAG: hypothetical protein J6C55_00685 [Oscillospiraceae bacterium]|nr:hypothetical protein [Oscillospiraceae bacterium]
MSRTNKKIISRINGLFFRNPTIMCQLSIAPIILVGVSLSNAVALSLAMFFVTVPTLICVSLIKNRLNPEVATMTYLLISALFYIPTGFFIKQIFPESLESLGIYLPMIVINSIIIIRSRGFANKNKVHWVFLDSLVYVIVFSIEICLISIIREVLGKGNLYGHKLNIFINFPALLLPFSGFILIGLLASLMQVIYNNRKKINIKKNINLKNKDNNIKN